MYDDYGEDLLMKYTVYHSKGEEDYYENGGYERDLEAMENARDIRRSTIWEGFLDDLGFKRDDPCRECPWMREGILEAYEYLADDGMILPEDVYDLARRMCECCKAHTEAERDDALDEFFKKEDEKNVTGE